MRSVYKYLKFAKQALLISTCAALVIFLWPGALPAVTGFTLYGLSIASLVGPSLLLQTGAIAALAFVGLHAIGLSLDIIGSLFDLVAYCCCSSKSKQEYPTSPTHHSYHSMGKTMPFSHQNPNRDNHTDDPRVHQPLYSQIPPPTTTQQPQNPSYQPM